jgi:hypothetical protein
MHHSMPTMLLERPFDQILASNMPPGRPLPDGGGNGTDAAEETDDEEEEADETE